MTLHRILAVSSLPVLLAVSSIPARAQDIASAKALSLLKTPSGWRIDDIVETDMPGLRSFLRNARRTPKAQASSVAPKA
jgi:hypothetical protein